MKRSFAVKLSLRFMFVLTIAVLLLSLSFLYFVRSLVNANQTSELKKNQERIFQALENMAYTEQIVDEEGSDVLQLLISDLPYYMTYIVYNPETEEIFATNDPFLPLLKETSGKAVHHFEKDFFFDGDLDILYYAESHILQHNTIGLNQQVVVAVAMNMENDSFAIIFTKLPLALLWMALPVLLLSFLVSLFITKNTIKPVVKITKAAQQMTTEKLDGQLPITGQGDEIDELSRTFNELFLRIKGDFDRERQFSSDVAHELNTPLTVISGQVNLLLRWGKENPEQLEKSLNAIKGETKSMHTIIENLLQISRVESVRVKPQLCEVDIREIFERVVDEFASVLPEVKFEIKTGDEGLANTLQTDPEMLHQIITVLVSNSVKFAGEKCSVVLGTVCGKDGGLVVYESDDGPGISEDVLPHVFERFFRGDEAHTRSAGGSGLGLSIAKTLCDALAAEISAGNVEPHGAKFQLYFPA